MVSDSFLNKLPLPGFFCPPFHKLESFPFCFNQLYLFTDLGRPQLLLICFLQQTSSFLFPYRYAPAWRGFVQFFVTCPLFLYSSFESPPHEVAQTVPISLRHSAFDPEHLTSRKNIGEFQSRKLQQDVLRNLCTSFSFHDLSVTSVEEALQHCQRKSAFQFNRSFSLVDGRSQQE